MKTINFIFITLLVLNFSACSSNEKENIPSEPDIYPSYGPPTVVTIQGLSFDAMEPFISPDGKYLFFNNLNDGIDTKLFYASIIDNTTFKFEGELTGANQVISPHLDAVADMDKEGNFYWTSTRNYPTELNNLHHGTFKNGIISNISRVQGNFNKNIPGWLTMDHGISFDGQYLYFNNARFNGDNCTGPCETELGIAQKNTDASFTQLANSDSILQNINDTNYIYYAPCISSDNLELYYTRYLKGTITPNTLFEVCVTVRTDSQSQFSIPKVLFSETIAFLIEAPTLTTDKSKMYYHQKTTDSHKIMLRYRK